jgi:methylphosphotriester-DNA--protein-cysteine methyltransferase
MVPRPSRRCANHVTRSRNVSKSLNAIPKKTDNQLLQITNTRKLTAVNFHRVHGKIAIRRLWRALADDADQNGAQGLRHGARHHGRTSG